MVLRKLHTNGTSTLVAIPKKLLLAAGMQPGDYVQLVLDKNLCIRLDPLESATAQTAKMAKRSEAL
jgi:antitoxin component of MazEF toxin-antitoxin module